MGFFKDVATLRTQGRQIQRSTDVASRMAGGLAAMQAANAVLVDRTTAAGLVATGVDATATVAALRPTGVHLNADPVVDVDLVVVRHGVPAPVSHRGPVPLVALGRLVPGAVVRVKLDPADPSAIWIDWFTPA